MGTVLLLTMMVGLCIVRAMERAASSTWARSASPATPEGVPTAMKMNSASETASS